MEQITYFSEKPNSIHFEQNKKNKNRVWMRKNITEEFFSSPDGESSQWKANEVYFETNEPLDIIQSNFDDWYSVGKNWSNSDVAIEFNKMKEDRISSFSKACEDTIYSGINVQLSDGKFYHFSLNTKDQINLASLQVLSDSGLEEIPYHADDELCKFFSAEDFSKITKAATEWKIYQTTYFNSLKNYINAITSIDELNKTYYGMIIPEEYSSDVLKTLSVDLNNYFA